MSWTIKVRTLSAIVPVDSEKADPLPVAGKVAICPGGAAATWLTATVVGVGISDGAPAKWSTPRRTAWYCSPGVAFDAVMTRTSEVVIWTVP